MIVLTAILHILTILNIVLIDKHNIHMLQLNNYKNIEYVKWFVSNFRAQWIIVFGLLLGGANLWFNNIFIYILILLTMLLYVWIYLTYCRMYKKTPLEYTARIVRLICTFFLLNILLYVIPIIIGCNFSFLLVLTSIQPLILVLANLMNSPMEKLIKKYYIHDAVKKMKAHTDLIVIGVTGSYGKTSVKNFLKTMLQDDYNVICTPKNYNTTMGVVKTIRHYLKPYHDVFICEMGARNIGDIKEICDIVSPDYGIITSIGPQHLSSFKTLENIQKTKLELADAIPETNFILLNADNDYIVEKINDYDNAISYASNNNASYKIRFESVTLNGSSFILDGENVYIRLDTKLIGSHNISNVACAAIMAYRLGVDLETIRKNALFITSVPHRLELKKINSSCSLIDDSYNSNPVSSKLALDVLKLFNGWKIIITPGLVELGKDAAKYNRQFGLKMMETCDYIIIVRSNASQSIIEIMEERNFNKKRYFVFNKFFDAYECALNLRRNENKCILLENDLPDNY